MTDRALSGPRPHLRLLPCRSCTRCTKITRSSCLKQPQSHGPPAEWRGVIPTSGSLSLDYVSTHAPGAKQATTLWGLPRLSANGAAAAAGSGSTAGKAPASASGAASAAGDRGSVARSRSVSSNGAAAGAVASGDGSVVQLQPMTDEQLQAFLRDHVSACSTASALSASLDASTAG